MTVENICPPGFYDPRIIWPSFEPLGLFTPASDVNALAQLAEMIEGRGKPLTFLEIGTWVGANAMQMAARGWNVDVVDHWLGNKHDSLKAIVDRCGESPEAVFDRNITLLTYKWDIRKFYGDGLTDEVRDLLVPYKGYGPYSIVYIDAEHDYDTTAKLIEKYKHGVCHGGVLAGHDYSADFPGVVRAVNEIGGGRIPMSNVWFKVMEW